MTDGKPVLWAVLRDGDREKSRIVANGFHYEIYEDREMGTRFAEWLRGLTMRVLNFTVELQEEPEDEETGEMKTFAVVRLQGEEILRLPVQPYRIWRVGRDDAAEEAVLDWMRGKLSAIQSA
jgi:hypothetical protein